MMNEAVLNIGKELEIIQMQRWPILVVYSPNDSVVNTTRIVEWFDGF